MPSIPKHLQGILWSVDVKKLNPDKDAPYIIHQILSYGRLEHIRWLFSAFPRNEIVNTFLTHPYKDYRASRFHFVKNYLLNLKQNHMNELYYVKNTPRDLSPV